jgi:hypothetical protein
VVASATVTQRPKQTPIWAKIAASIALAVLLDGTAALVGIASSEGPAIGDGELTFLGFLAAANAFSIFDLMAMFLYVNGHDTVATDIDIYAGEFPPHPEQDPISRGMKIIIHLVLLTIIPYLAFWTTFQAH